MSHTFSYRRSALQPRIVHIGVGGFHRSHLAAYCHELAALGSDWGICGIGLLPQDRDMAAMMRRNDCCYELVTRSGDDEHRATIGSIVEYVFAPDDASEVVERIARPVTAIVSLTVTEAGYTDEERTRRTFDVIAEALARRRVRGHDGVTVMSCDNMLSNGAATRRCVLAAAARVDLGLHDWVERTCAFPNSMVDRITPAAPPEAPLVAEAFRQWVLEDRFVAGRPDVEAVGAIITDDVHSWELYKLRLLNAGHTAMAHLAALAGIEHVDAALAHPDLRAFLEDTLLLESAPTLTPIPGHPVEGYVAQVLERFANTAIRDRIARIAVDSSAKFATFVAPIVHDQLRSDGRVDHFATACAAWMHYRATVPPDQQAADPAAAELRPLDDLLRDGRFAAAYASAAAMIATHGPIEAARAVRGTRAEKHNDQG